MNADQEDAHPWIGEQKRLLAELVEGGSPLLGVCLGAQLLAEAIGGRARRASAPEIGWPTVELTPEGAADPLLGPLAPSFEAFQWHSYECDLPESAIVLARSAVCVQAYRYGPAAWGIQFHAEVSQRTSAAGSTTTRPIPTRSRSASTPSGRRPRARSGSGAGTARPRRLRALPRGRRRGPQPSLSADAAG